MLRNGPLPGRDSCDFSPKRDDSTKKCVDLSLADEVPSFRSESYGVPITFSSPRSREALLDLMVATINAKDLRKCSTLVICQQNAEARHVKSEMGKRNINSILLDADHLTAHNLVRLWSQGYIQQVLIACDDRLNLLEGTCPNFVIHTALPPVEKFKERLKMLSKSESRPEMLAFISDGPKDVCSPRALTREDGSVKDVPVALEESLLDEPESEGLEAPPEVQRFVLPVEENRLQMLSKCLKMLSRSEIRPEIMAFFSDGTKDGCSPCALTRENESEKDVPMALEESLPDEPESEGLEAPPEVQSFVLPVEKDRLKTLSKSDSRPEMAFFSDGPKDGCSPCALKRENGSVKDVPVALEVSVPDESESEGWETPPEIETFVLPVENLKDPLRKMSAANKKKIRGLRTIEEMRNAFDDQLNDILAKSTQIAWSPSALTQENEPESEGWTTPPEIKAFELPVENFKDRLSKLNKFNFFPDDPKKKIQDLPALQDIRDALDKPINDILAMNSTVVWSSRALTRKNVSVKDVPVALEESLPDEPESKGWKTAPTIQAASVIGSEGGGMTQAQYGVVVWSRDLIIPCHDPSGIPGLNPSIRNTMRTLMEDMMERQARSLQRFAWPHVSSGKSLVVVGPEKVGKSWCFLPSLCQRTHEQMLLRSEKLYGPTSIVVSLSQHHGNQILQWIIKLMDPLNTGDCIPYTQVVSLWENGNAKEVADRLRHPVGILVTTPDMLIMLKELNTKDKPIFSAKSVKCLALENLSDMMRYLPNITAKMVEWLFKLDFKPDGCQLFVTTHLWPEILMRENLLQRVRDVLIAFKDPLEATIFWKSSLEINLVKPEEKCRALVQMLRDRNANDKRIVVVCNTKEEVLDLQNQLLREGIRAEGVYSDNGKSTAKKWRLGTLGVVLLVADNILNSVNIGRIDQLIHYTPAISWMRFKFRFSLLHNNYISSAKGGPGKAVVLIQQSDFDHLWLLSEFIMLHQLPRPDRWLSVLAESRQAQDKPSLELARLPLCEHMCSYGDCFRRTCRYRHVMWREEVQPPANYPTEGEFCFRVLTCNTPTQLAVRLNKVSTKCYILKTPMSQLGHEVHVYYEKKQNQRQHAEPKVNDIVIVRNLKRYERAVIVGMNDMVVTVRLLDTGIDVLTYEPSLIFLCEERHQNEPGQAMEVRLIGIEPATMDRIWTKDMRDAVRSTFFSRLPGKRGRKFYACVKLVMSRTIFVDTVIDDSGQDLRNYILNRFSVHDELWSMKKLIAVADASQPSPKEP